MKLLRSTMLTLFVLGIFPIMVGAKVPAQGAKLQLANGAPSVDALLDELLAALAKRDEQAMHRLRITEREYRDIIIPGTVQPGQPPRQVADMPSQYFWSMLNQKSEDIGRLIMQRFGGHTYVRKELTYTKGVRKFAWYTAMGEVRLHLEDEEGAKRVLLTGSIAEVHGRYKFIGFNYND